MFILFSHYFVNFPAASDESLYRLYLDEVAPSTLFVPPYNSSVVLITGTGLLRYDLFAGAVIVDDMWTLCPFAEPYNVIEGVRGNDLQKAMVLLNSDKYDPFKLQAPGFQRRGRPPPRNLPNYLWSSEPEAGRLYDVLGTEWDITFISQALGEVEGAPPPTFNVYSDINTTEVWLNWME